MRILGLIFGLLLSGNAMANDFFFASAGPETLANADKLMNVSSYTSGSKYKVVLGGNTIAKDGKGTSNSLWCYRDANQTTAPMYWNGTNCASTAEMKEKGVLASGKSPSDVRSSYGGGWQNNYHVIENMVQQAEASSADSALCASPACGNPGLNSCASAPSEACRAVCACHHAGGGNWPDCGASPATCDLK